MLIEFQSVLEKYWLLMVVKLAMGEAVWISSTDTNFGVDTAGNFRWITDGGWKSLINATNHLTDEEKFFLFNRSTLK